MSLLQLLGIDHPILQAPMAGVSTPAMAAAVSNAGALGALGLGSSTAGSARKMISDFRASSTRPLHVNLFCHRPAKANPEREAAWSAALPFADYGATPPATLKEIYRSFVEDEAMLAMLVQERPEVVSFHFGVPSAAQVRALRDAGSVLIAAATSLAEARRGVEAGMQAIIAQGWEAGGHRGVFDEHAPDDRLGTFALVSVLARSLSVPVIAAGGIMNGAGIAAALRLGASAASLGTAFVGCPESSADDGYRRALDSEAAHHTTMTRAISGRPARCLANRFTEMGDRTPNDAIPDYPIAYDAGKSLHAAAKARGEYGFGAQWAGQGAPLARAMPAGELVRTLVQEMKAAPAL
jgi:nitronate monooxygenase